MPGHDEPDYALPHWAGVVPIATAVGQPIPDPRLTDGTETPGYIREFSMNSD